MAISTRSHYSTLVFMVVLWCSHVSVATKSRLVIGGLAGIDIQNEGWSSAGVIPAVELALERVNNHSEILKDYYLDIEWKDSKCASGFGIKSMIEHLTETPSKIAFLGPGCSIAADPVAETLPFWNLTEISFSLTSPILSNKEKYPNIYRINPSEIIHDPALLALTNHFNWERLFIIKHELGLFNLITEALQAMLTRNKKRVNVVGFLRNATSPIKLLKDQGARILIVYMYESQARDLFCAAFKNEFYGPEIVWILRGWYQKQWWTIPDTECSVEDMRKVMTNVIYADHVNYGTNKNVTVLGLTQAEFQDKYNELIRKKNSTIYDANKYAPYSYDGIFMLAHALNATEEELKRMNQSLRDFTYARLDITEIIKEKISKTDDIEGLTGDIKLDKRGDRIVNVWLQQLQGGDHDVVNIALYNTENNSINFLPSKSFIWAGGDVPLDKRAETKILLCISRRIFWWTVGISICGLFIAFYFLWLNAKNGEERYFKMSTPPLNNLMIIGAIISYIYVPICGVKSCTMNATFTNSILCKVMCSSAFTEKIAFHYNTLCENICALLKTTGNFKTSLISLIKK